MVEYTFLPFPEPDFIHPARQILGHFQRDIVRPNQSNKNLASSQTMKSLLDETFPDHEIFFFSPLSYFKNIKDLEKPTFWVLTTRNLVPSGVYAVATPYTISYGFAFPSDDDWYGADLGVKILWLNTLRWRKVLTGGASRWTGLGRRPYGGDDDPILSKMAKDFPHRSISQRRGDKLRRLSASYKTSALFDENWEKEGYWTKENFDKLSKWPNSERYNQKVKLFVMPLAPRESLGVVNWVW